jgi:hypothetical protein
MPASSQHIAGLVEKQMRNWEIARAQHMSVQKAPCVVADFITVSRSFGSGGKRIGELLGERLQWPVFDDAILSTMANDDALRRVVYESLDERDLTWFERTLRSLMLSDPMPNDYFQKLTETILSLARKGPGVFVGRAGHLILPQDHGLRVRIVAPIERRAEAIASRLDLEINRAAAEIQRIDGQRRQFARDHFGVDWDEVTHHDIVLNIERLTPDAAVELIIHGLKTATPDTREGRGVAL